MFTGSSSGVHDAADGADRHIGRFIDVQIELPVIERDSRDGVRISIVGNFGAANAHTAVICLHRKSLE